jgi:hypothetical protein
MKKTKRYSVGGEADADAKSGIVTKFGKTPGGEDTFERDREVLKTQDSGPSSFKDAFASARKSGDKLFEYDGKKYTTDLASKKSATPKPSVEATPESGADKRRKLESLRKEQSYNFTQGKKGASSNEDTSYALNAMKKGGKVSSASSRADGIAQRGKTRGKMC